MLNESKIAFIGSGAMGEAMIKGILAQKLMTPNQITASDPVATRREQMQAVHGIQTTDNNLEAVRNADIILLCIKPQVLDMVGAGLRGQIAPDALVISIMAGITLHSIQKSLGHQRVVRAMPNTPAQINLGMTVWIATPDVTEVQRKQTGLILGALGEQLSVEKEDFIDMQTGLGGSGPGFVFLIVEAMIDAGVHMGFSRPDAQQIVLQTMAGSVALVKATGQHPAQLKNLVTSAGGTTAAGLYELEKAGLRAILNDAIFAAYRRSQALGKSSEK
ncbi:pyrroline-5-carboxylate reductase [soil metagenome]